MPERKGGTELPERYGRGMFREYAPQSLLTLERIGVVEFCSKEDLRSIPSIPESYKPLYSQLLKRLDFGNERAPLKLRAIYDFLEGYGKFVSTFAVCSKGCAYCCHIDVSITDLEAKLIEEETGRKRVTSKTRPTAGHTERCPFLTTDNGCSIYKVRPFHCRTFHTLDDPKYCKTGERHQIYGSYMGQYSVTMYAKLSRKIKQLNRNSPILDIRDFYG